MRQLVRFIFRAVCFWSIFLVAPSFIVWVDHMMRTLANNDSLKVKKKKKKFKKQILSTEF